jgi:hypothetical protein
VAVSERIGRHLRGNAVAYLALFVALTGTAVALPGHDNVKSKNIATGAVKAKAIAKDAVKASKIKDAAVTNPAIAPGAISSTKIAAGAVVTNTLGDAAVTTPKLADSAVTRQKVAQGSINGGKLANASVDSAKVENGSLLGEDFAAGQLSDGFVLDANGNFTVARAGPLFVIATLAPTCPAPPCTYTVQIGGAPVPSATFTGTPPGQLTLIGVSSPQTAGTHSISLQVTGAGASASQLHLGGILLQ